MKEIKCEKCGQTLKLLHWNSQTDILICSNDKCPAYRNPVQHIEIEFRWEDLTPKKSHKKQVNIPALVAPES